MLTSKRSWLYGLLLIGCSGSDRKGFGGELDSGMESRQGSMDATLLHEAGMDSGRRNLDASPVGQPEDVPLLPDGNLLQCGDLTVRLRDLKDTHPDFETYITGLKKGIVSSTLGPDNRPVLAASMPLVGVMSEESFSQWYRDLPGINQSFDLVLSLTKVGNSYEYSNNEFFPLDDLGFGKQGREHNFHFTTEVHTEFFYRGGELFSFSGDDDLWIFVNGRLALDLGGVHSPATGTIDFDAQAADLGITRNQTYRMDVFHAERHTTASNFTIRTNIECFKPVFFL